MTRKSPRASKKRALRWLLLLLASAALLAHRVHARSYTDADIQVMKKTYETTNHRRVEDAKFPMEVMREPWHDPPVVARMLPYTQWDEEYRKYFLRHTGDPTITLKPTILVMHYTACSTFQAAWDIFYNGANMANGDKGTVWGHPSVHFMIDRDGTIYQLMPLDRRATGTYGVNHCALQVEMVGVDEADIVNNPLILKSSFRLARMLSTRFGIPANKIYGHYDVSDGKSVVPEYLDKADDTYPTSYPPSSTRTDPGTVYMSWLKYYLRYAQ